jgi:outer membrane protein assembly factor BamA
MDNVQEQVDSALQERARQRHELQWAEFVNKYALSVLFPAKVLPKDKSRKVKTDKDLINARLLENGLLFEDLQTLPQIQMGVAQVVDNLQRTGCFQSVQLQLATNENTESSDEYPHQLEVILDEKNWYSLYIGGGFKHEGFEESLNNGTKLPKAQFEVSATFPNLTGYLDSTLLRYTVDQTSTSSLLLSHERPLYSWFGDTNAIGAYLLALPKGSQYSLGMRAVLDTVDYEWTRSYKEYMRYVSCRLDNNGQVQRPDMVPGYYWGLDWSLSLRDIIPRKHSTLPYSADASPEIVALSGTSLKHSLTWEARTNGTFCDDRVQPTAGLDWYSKMELAGPPGDVGYAKAQGGAAVHLPLIKNGILALHGTCSGGYLKPISYSGACRPATIGDRFFVGGPMQLRGFLPAGIGPRTKSGGSTSPGGDSLGGTMYYTASVAASISPPGILRDYGVRLFGFANAGTLVGTTDGIPLQAIVNSTRTSVGGGVTASTPMGRMEATYAWPIRHGPRDARRNLQFGFGFNFG